MRSSLKTHLHTRARTHTHIHRSVRMATRVKIGSEETQKGEGEDVHKGLGLKLLFVEMQASQLPFLKLITSAMRDGLSLFYARNIQAPFLCGGLAHAEQESIHVLLKIQSYTIRWQPT